MDAPRQAPFHLTNEPLLRWRIGPVTVTRIVEGITEFSSQMFLPSLSKEQIKEAGDWAEPFFTADKRRLLLSCHSFLVETPQSTIVVDTCVGTHQPRSMQTDPTFLDRLIAAIPGGRENVDAVVCTHLHFDHVGGNTIEIDGALQPTFPNARYLISEAELAATLETDHMGVIDESVRPLLDAGVLDAVAADHRIDTWTALVSSPGHSPGHVCLSIETDDAAALITGDAVHSPLQFTYPFVSAEIADHDSNEATRTRERLIDRLADTNTLVLGTHFPTPTAGHLRGGPLPWIDPVAGDALD